MFDYRPGYKRLLRTALVLTSLVAFLSLSATAGAVPQTFWAQGAGDFGADVRQSGGGEMVLSQVTAGVVRWKDTSSAKDLTFTVSTGQQPVSENGWQTLYINLTPTDITLKGSKFRVKGDASFTASIHGHGRVRTLGGKGLYGVGDDGNGNPIIQWSYNVKRVKVGVVTTRALTITGRGQMIGDFDTLGKWLNFRGRRFGGGRFVDKSTGQDMEVNCRGVGAKKRRTNSKGRQVIRCLGRRGRAKVKGSNVRFRVSAGRLVASFPKDIAGHLRGRVGAKYHGFFSPF